MKKIFFIIALIFIAGCVQTKDFNYGMKQITALNSKYNTTMETYPKNMKQIDAMLIDFIDLEKLQLETGQEPFKYIIDYIILNLEAEKLYIWGQKYGDAGTTKNGFGCKIKPLIIESVFFRNSSAQKGFESVVLLREFVEKYPKEANSVGFSYKNAIFLNATFYQIYTDANSDSHVINYFCPKNETLEIYQRQFKKETNLSEDFINNLTYEQAVPIWKEIVGIN